MNCKITEKSWFKYVIIGVILLIPFMYAFFYLKAYWNPYGEGNMDNIPVAIVNLDDGEKGKDFVNKLLESKKLDFQVTGEKEAQDGIYNKKYYAAITIPHDFSLSLESAGEVNKVPATITYSPNQKTNYLASQIISRVLVVAEEEARGEVSSTVVSTLIDKLNLVPEKMLELSEGTKKLEDGASALNSGIDTLNDKYQDFDKGINTLYNGSLTLTEGINEISSGINTLQAGSTSLDNGVKQINDALNSTDLGKLGDLTDGINLINNGVNGDAGLVNGINQYVSGSNSVAGGIIELDGRLDSLIEQYSLLVNETQDPVVISQLQGTIGALQTIKQSINNPDANLVLGAKTLLGTGDNLIIGARTLQGGVNRLSDATSDIQKLGTSIDELHDNLKKVQTGTTSLNSGISKLNDGTSRLKDGSQNLSDGISTINNSSSQIKVALGQIDSGSNDLKTGIISLRSAVDNSINSSKNELGKLEGLADFVTSSVTINEEPINEINSYGTAFGPFFMSIALWVGSLMLFIILYYDKDDRFKLLGKNANNRLLRTGCYLGLAILQGISLGVLLMIGLDFEITNYFLYFISLILVACLFESIMEFLIVNFGDVGKFLSLILLVLQLAAAGGTFPIQTVTKGFRFLNPLLPMTYTCNLFKETIISIESGLLTRSLVVIVVLFIVLLIFNIIKDLKENKI